MYPAGLRCEGAGGSFESDQLAQAAVYGFEFSRKRFGAINS